MIVVADSSPLIVLLNIGHAAVLPELFGEIVVPAEVAAELSHEKRPQVVKQFMASRPAWLVERTPTSIEPIPALDAGEIAAISLALELAADLLLIDEIDGRKAATDRNIPITGTIGVLELAADRGLIDLQQAFSLVKSTDFWISPQLLDERLNRWLQRKEP
jgi:predicted nucleic acid-binding protein